MEQGYGGYCSSGLEVGGLDTGVTFTECGYSGPVGGSTAHVVEANSPQLIGGVGPQTCTHHFNAHPNPYDPQGASITITMPTQLFYIM